MYEGERTTVGNSICYSRPVNSGRCHRHLNFPMKRWGGNGYG